MNLISRIIIGTGEDPSLQIESFAIILPCGVSTKLYFDDIFRSTLIQKHGPSSSDMYCVFNKFTTSNSRT